MNTTEYVLLASVYYQRQEDGTRKRYRRGDTVTGLSAAEAHRLLGIEAIAMRTADPEPDREPEPPAEVVAAPSEGEGDGKGGATGVAKPPQVATKSALVAWLADHPAPRHGKSRAELESLDKGQLWELIANED